MPTEVVMPQMGESIAEGTIVRWIKKVGDKVDRDEPLFEISTDKVDAEIPSPAAGVVAEIRAKEGETVPVNSVVAVIGSAAAAPAPKPAETPKPSTQGDGSPAAAQTGPEPDAAAGPAEAGRHEQEGPGNRLRQGYGGQEAGRHEQDAERPEQRPERAASAGRPKEADRSGGPERIEQVIRQRSSPLVRRIAKDHNIDISQLHGSGIAGRVTKADIVQFIDRGAAPTRTRIETPAQGGRAPAAPPTVSQPAVAHAASDHVEKMSVMRKRIAEHMTASRRTSAHVHSVFEVNFSRVAQAREARKAEFEHAGTKLTYLSFIIKAVVDALRAMPVVNASVDGENVVFHRDINIGIAVALDWGLIVPVIKNADERNLLGLSRAVADLANRARAKQLKPEDVQGGTFTITNPGVFGALFGMPIINQPQVAILGVGNVEKRPVVIEDAIAIRPMAYLTLGYDHRLIDGAVADQFMSIVKRTLESWDPSAV
jgi:2-oxoglutarate dehydrogenase E2 component (dihydrolipoamide succinyltransferase)